LNDSELAYRSGNGWIAKHRSPRHARRDLLQHLNHFTAEAKFGLQEASRIAARFCKAIDEAGADWIGNVGKYDRNAAGRLQKRRKTSRSRTQQKVRRLSYQLYGILTQFLGACA
jgi:hypothetical protein